MRNIANKYLFAAVPRLLYRTRCNMTIPISFVVDPAWNANAICDSIDQRESHVQREEARSWWSDIHSLPEVTRSSTAPAVAEDAEEEQPRKAIEESLQLEQDRMHRKELYHRRLRENKHITVVLFGDTQ